MTINELLEIARNPRDIVYHDEDVSHIPSTRLREMLQGLRANPSTETPGPQAKDILAMIRNRNR